MSKTAEKIKVTELLAVTVVLMGTLALLVIMALGVGQITDILRQPATASRPTGTTAVTLRPNPYTAADFALENGYVTCLAGDSMLGVDVSEFQGIIDWPTVAANNIGFAMIRIGGRGWGAEGRLYEDVCWKLNLEGARAAGLQVGVYF